MTTRILLIQGHPDSGKRHFLHALEDAYAQGARELGCELRRIEIARLEFPLLRSQEEWEHGNLPAGLDEAQQAIQCAGDTRISKAKIGPYLVGIGIGYRF